MLKLMYIIIIGLCMLNNGGRSYKRGTFHNGGVLNHRDHCYARLSKWVTLFSFPVKVIPNKACDGLAIQIRSTPSSPRPPPPYPPPPSQGPRHVEILPATQQLNAPEDSSLTGDRVWEHTDARKIGPTEQDLRCGNFFSHCFPSCIRYSVHSSQCRVIMCIVLLGKKSATVDWTSVYAPHRVVEFYDRVWE